MGKITNAGIGIGVAAGLGFAGLAPEGGEDSAAVALENMSAFMPLGMDIATQAVLAVPGVANTIDGVQHVADAIDGGTMTDAVKGINSSFSDGLKSITDLFHGDFKDIPQDLLLAPFRVIADLGKAAFNIVKDTVKNVVKIITHPIKWIKGVASAVGKLFGVKKKNMFTHSRGIDKHATNYDKSQSKLSDEKDKLAQDQQNAVDNPSKKSDKAVKHDKKSIKKEEKKLKKEDKNLYKDASGLEKKTREQEQKIHSLQNKISTEKPKDKQKDQKKLDDMKNHLQNDIKAAKKDAGSNPDAQAVEDAAIQAGTKEGDAGGKMAALFNGRHRDPSTGSTIDTAKAYLAQTQPAQPAQAPPVRSIPPVTAQASQPSAAQSAQAPDDYYSSVQSLFSSGGYQHPQPEGPPDPNAAFNPSLYYDYNSPM